MNGTGPLGLLFLNILDNFIFISLFLLYNIIVIFFVFYNNFACILFVYISPCFIQTFILVTYKLKLQTRYVY